MFSFLVYLRIKNVKLLLVALKISDVKMKFVKIQDILKKIFNKV